MKRDSNHELYQAALGVIPSGVNSPVRAFKAVGGEPIFMKRGKGSRIWSADGNEYLDYIQSWGAMIHTTDAEEGAQIIKNYEHWITDQRKMSLAKTQTISAMITMKPSWLRRARACADKARPRTASISSRASRRVMEGGPRPGHAAEGDRLLCG